MNGVKRVGPRFGWLVLGVALIALLSCGDEGDEAGESRIHDTGQEILGEPQAIVATVDGTPIALAEVDLVAQYWVATRALELQMARSRKELQQRALNQIVDQVLLSTEAERRQISVPDSAIEGMTAAWKAGFATTEDMQAKLKESHLTEEMIRVSLKRDLLVRALSESVRDTIPPPSTAELRDYYAAHPEYFDTTQVRASHILFFVPEDAPADSVAAKRELAESTLAEIRAGADFEQMVAAHSDCPSRDQAGDLGYKKRMEWVKPFADAAFALEPGEISDVVQTQFGYHIIKVTGKRAPGWHPFDAAAPWIARTLVDTQIQTVMTDLARNLRAAARVELRF